MTTAHKIKWILLSFIAILFVFFVSQNTGVTTVRFLGWEVEAPRMLLMTAIGLTGFIAGVLTVLLYQRHRRHSHPESNH